MLSVYHVLKSAMHVIHIILTIRCSLALDDEIIISSAAITDVCYRITENYMIIIIICYGLSIISTN